MLQNQNYVCNGAGTCSNQIVRDDGIAKVLASLDHHTMVVKRLILVIEGGGGGAPKYLQAR